MSNDHEGNPKQTESKRDPSRMPTIAEFMDNLVESAANRDWKFIRIVGPSADSGWLLTGDNPHESAKYHARQRYNGGEGFYFIAKYDKSDPNLRTPDTARPIYGRPDPEPIWHRQKPWQGNFPLPDDLWQEPKGNRNPEPYPSRDEIRKGIVRNMRKDLSKGPTDGESASVALLRACLGVEER